MIVGRGGSHLRDPNRTPATLGSSLRNVALREFNGSNHQRGNFRGYPGTLAVSPRGRAFGPGASGAVAVDKRLYLDINRFATRTAWAHGVLAFFARPTALVILAVLVVLAIARARAVGVGGSDPDQIASLLWVV